LSSLPSIGATNIVKDSSGKRWGGHVGIDQFLVPGCPKEVGNKFCTGMGNHDNLQQESKLHLSKKSRADFLLVVGGRLSLKP